MIFCGCSYCAERSFARKTLKRWGYRRNADLSRRQLQRSQDPQDQARLIREKIRAGELSEHNVLLAAYLFDPGALIYTGGDVWDSSVIPPEYFEGDARLRIILRHAGLDKQFVVRCAIDFARRALHIWERYDPNDSRPSRAIAAAEYWLEVNTDAAVMAAAAASWNATDATARRRRRTTISVWNAAWAATAAANAAGYPDSDPRRSAARLPGDYAADASRGAQLAADNSDAELRWQTQRAINYLLGRPQPEIPRRNPYSQEDRDKVIAECRDTDLSYRAIALKTGVSRETVSRWCREAGYPRQRGRNGVPQVKRQKILFLYKNTDLNFSQIARHPDVELPRTTVRDIIKFQDVTKNPVHESRLTGLLTMAIWPTDDVNEANNAKRLALNILNNVIADDINELKLIFRKVIGQAGSHLGSNERLEAIWEEATNQNPELTISYRELLGETKKKPVKKKTTKKKTTKKKPAKKKTTYRRTRRSGVCILCGEDSRGKPYCRRHYYEFIGREYYETCQVPGCDNLSFGQPKCREHYYGGRRRRTRRRRPRRPYRRNPKYRRNVDESLRRLEREAAAGGGKEAYYRQLVRTGQPIPSVAKAHQKLMRAIRNFPMARTHQLRQQYGVNRPSRTSMTKQPFLQRPEEAIEYILPADSEDKQIIDASMFGQIPIVILLDSLEEVIDRTYILLEPDRPAGGGEVVAGLQSVYYGNYTLVAEAARGLAKAAAEIRFMFIDGEKDAIWEAATALLQEVIGLSAHATGLVSGPRRVVKSLQGRIKEFGKRIISKSRISHITGEITELANLMRGSTSRIVELHTAIRLRVINRRWIYLIAHLLMIAKKFK